MTPGGEEPEPLPGAITKADLYRLGLSGGPDSAALRRRLLKELDLPGALSANAMPGVLSRLMTLAQLETEMTRLRGR